MCFFSVFAFLLLSASVSAATTANENERIHQQFRRRLILNEQQVSLKVNPLLPVSAPTTVDENQRSDEQLLPFYEQMQVNSSASW
jgi:hypothetical protein